jgi:hypothetical protein
VRAAGGDGVACAVLGVFPFFFLVLVSFARRQEWETRDDEEAVDVTKAGKKPWWTKKAKSATTTKKQVWATKKPFRGWQGGLKLRRRWNLRSRSRFSYLSTEARRLRRLRRQRERFGL